MNKKRIAIDLLWLRHGKVGGSESYIMNLLDGMILCDLQREIYLFTARDNYEIFKDYEKTAGIIVIKCNVDSSSIFSRILFQNIMMEKLLAKYGIDVCFEPVYSMPLLANKEVKYIVTIHDLQGFHYPQYFSKSKIIWMRLSWKNAITKADTIIAISENVKTDIINHYHNVEDKIRVIYNPIVLHDSNDDESETLDKYKVEKSEYYYTVSSLLPHKNLVTLVKVFSEICRKNLPVPKRLIVSGVGGKQLNMLETMIKSRKLEGVITITGFISDCERNVLYKNCKAFLFPSVFEGFGMPPIEAIFFGVPVITTRCSSIPEVTFNKCNYVDDPYNVDEWINMMLKNLKPIEDFDFDEYDAKSIAEKYLCIFNKYLED